MIVIKIGGCNGSGKSSVARALSRHYGAPRGLERPGKPDKWEGYAHDLPKPENGLKRIVVLGSYEVACGGMDGVSGKDVRLALIEKYSKPENIVVFEGVLIGTTYGEVGEISEREGQKGKWIYAFMDTPFDVCVERVRARRLAAGNEKPLDPEKSMRGKVRSANSVARRAEAAGHKVIWLDHTKSPKVLAGQLIRAALKLAAWSAK